MSTTNRDHTKTPQRTHREQYVLDLEHDVARLRGCLSRCVEQLEWMRQFHDDEEIRDVIEKARAAFGAGEEKHD